MADKTTEILTKISGDIGFLRGTVTEIKSKLDNHIAANDKRHDENEDRIGALEDTKKKMVYITLGLSTGGAFAGSKLAAFINALLGGAP